MKGEIFNLLESFMSSNFGEFSFQDIVEEIPSLEKRNFISPKTYSDTDFFKIFLRVCEKYKLDPSDTQKKFGLYSFPILKNKVSETFNSFTDFSKMLNSIDSVIHMEVAKIIPGAETPLINVLSETKNTFLVEYKSSRSLCHFMEGLLQASAEYYYIQIAIEQTQCKLLGDHSSCIFKIEKKS